MDFAEEIRDFLIESNENLAALDQQIVELEKNPTDEKLIASVFRTIHTVKGTSGFFGFTILGSIAHVAENILGQVREKQRPLTPELVSLVLETMDAIRAVLARVEADGVEGEDFYQDLRTRLDDAYHYRGSAAAGSKLVQPADPAHIDVQQTDQDPQQLVREKHSSPQSPLAQLPLQPAAEAVLFPEPGLPAQPVAVDEPIVAPPPVRQRDTDAASGATDSHGKRPDDPAANSTIRVDVRLLDKLMNLVGELVLARNQIMQGSAASSSGTAQRLNLITSELQEGVMRTRMQPIGMVWNKLPRVVRDLASELGKKIHIQMEGAETELDKTIIEAIKDPLTHIVRNSCDHGVEVPETRIAKGKSAEGTVLLRAFHEGGHVNIEISDDGAGIDPEKVKNKAIEKGLIRPEQAAGMSEWEALRLIFLPGFSTAEKVTNISGRGVGMDVVKTNIEKIGGTVDLTNRTGAGSTIKIKIPLTLAIIPGLIVSVYSAVFPDGSPEAIDDSKPIETHREHRFVIPQANLLELVRLEGAKDHKQIAEINGARVYRRRGKLLPLAYLSEVLALPATHKEEEITNIVVVQAEETAFGLVVDRVSDTQEIVVKALGKQLKALSCYIGATIMGDGKIALILDVTGVAGLAQLLSQQAERGKLEARSDTPNARQTLLLFRAGRYPRLVLPLAMVARLEEFPRERIEYAAGLPVIGYRDSILPLISLSSLIDAGAPDGSLESAFLQVVVFSEGERYIGMVVDEIIDIVDDAVTIKRAGSTFGLLGSGVVGGKVTDFVDLGALLEAAKSGTAGSLGGTPEKCRRLLLVDRTKIHRGVLRGYLEMHGHQVLEAVGVPEAMKLLEPASVDVVLVAVEPGESPTAAEHGAGLELIEAMHRLRELNGIPVLALYRNGQQASSHEEERFDACLMREDRDAILRAVQALPGSPVRRGNALAVGAHTL